MKELSIGQMARLNGVSEQALRLYDKVGLFSPMYRDRENGYRYYDIRQSAQLDMIQHMKALGMSLKDIKEQMKHFDPDMLRNILYRNLDAIDQKAQELMYRRRAIERTLESYEWYENAPPDGTIVLEYIPRRLTYMTDSGVNFYDYGIDVYEKILRELKKNLIANQLSPIYFYNAGTVMKKEALLAGRFCSTEIFVLVDKGFVKESLITQIPASTYLCIYCNSFDKEKDYIERLLEEIRTREYRITGDYICEVVAEVPMDMQERGMFLRLQVPVSLRAKDV
ncbi:MerR family transcriptional regulator [Enterocloster citroniae]|uniref:MerR family transcriptional regulator n=1 Tax=Enterocloster citroniae TaxID=358743 RepID=UPI00349E5AFF